MASWDAPYDKYRIKKLSRLTKDTTEEEIKDLYKNWATTYDKDVLQEAQIIFRKPLAECLDAAIKQVFPDKTQSRIKIIDAGAGTGLAGVELFKLGYTNIDALDISQEMLNEAKKKNIYKKFICASLTEQRIPEIETGEYHAMISTGTLGTAHARPEAIEEMIRMVKPGKSTFDDSVDVLMRLWQ
ncbi:Williams-Beuren syndrome chromosomal region 27 protein-like [Orbicella faveolata]|uniref:Williams-Beuren syndrome chromosomal region 27 protein-like n=1 Tax=Orbicella faveolata TaxID=48498 RepID=UPI0009E2962D|nr:Williams-Beuren syndrome chromosomal region 27 protein-like [Orbicella faveolata]